MAVINDYFAALDRKPDVIQALARFLAPRRPDTWAHAQAVAQEAVGLARRFELDVAGAQVAGHGHDLAAVVPKPAILAVAEQLDVIWSDADRLIPQILHGRIAAAVMEAKLGVIDPDVLDAMRYHTTLRARPSGLELAVFVADKLAYDPTTPRVDYLPAVQSGLERSLEAAALAYLDFCVRNQPALGWRLHPDLIAAHGFLKDC